MKSKLLSALVLAIILFAVLAFPAFAKGAPSYISEQTRQNMIRVFAPLILVVTICRLLSQRRAQG